MPERCSGTHERSMADVMAHHGPYRDDSADRIEFVGDARDLLNARRDGCFTPEGSGCIRHRKTPLSAFSFLSSLWLAEWSDPGAGVSSTSSRSSRGQSLKGGQPLPALALCGRSDLASRRAEIPMSVGYTSPLQAMYEGTNFVKRGADYIEMVVTVLSPTGSDARKAA